LRICRAKEPAVLSDVLPILENLGLRVIAEEPFRIDSVDGGSVWIHEFQLDGVSLLSTVAPVVRTRFEEALVAVWTGRVESDGFNRLVLGAGCRRAKAQFCVSAPR
jgi:glutamate dehydrogenase